MTCSRNHPTSQERGFTIVELLISTVVFGLILLVVTTAILQFTRVYYRGITEANTQETARGIIDQMSQSIQFSGGDVTNTPAPTPGSAQVFCIGNQQYSYALGVELSDNPTSTQSPHALVVRDQAGCAGSAAQNVRSTSVTGKELIGPHMRLSALKVTNLGNNLYSLTVRVVYGDDEVLDDPNTATASCKNLKSGTRFCAVSSLTTTVTKRVK